MVKLHPKHLDDPVHKSSIIPQATESSSQTDHKSRDDKLNSWLVCYPNEGLTPTKDGATCLRRLSMFRKEVH